MKRIPYGITDYKSLITEDYYYVDKTMYLEKLENLSNKNIVYLKPRRFGKTLFTSMMYYYYDINSKNLYDDLYKNTYIYNHETKNKNNYYILKFDFSGMTVISNNKDSIMNAFSEKIYNGINDFIIHYNLNFEIDNNLFPAELFGRFITYFKSLNLNNKIYIIIDEYDNFTNTILSSNMQMFKDIHGTEGFLKAFYARIKENTGTVIDRVFITGVCSISLDSMTSGFNIASNITTDSMFNSMTSLTHEEVKKLINDMDVNNKDEVFKEMLENYDGYCFNRREQNLVFNPTLTMYYLNNLTSKGLPPEELLDSNILSSYDQIKNIISLGDYKEVIRDIFDNDEIEVKLKENFNLNNNSLYKFEKEDIVSLLFYFGYLTIERLGYFGIVFRIPNKVIYEVFCSYFLEILKELEVKIDNNETNYGLIEMVEHGRINKISKVVSDVIEQDSFRDYIGMSESVIKHVYLTLLNGNNAFEIFSEQEVKKGYIDILFKNKSNFSKYNILMELKYISKKNKNTYDKVLKDGYEQVNKYIEDKRLNKVNLKKYIVIFINSQYTITEVK